MSSRSKNSPKAAAAATKKASPKKAVPEPVVAAPTVEETVAPTQVEKVEKVLSAEEIDVLNHYINEEHAGRIIGADHVDFVVSRPADAAGLTIPEGFVYQAGFIQRFDEICKMVAKAAKAGNKDTFDYTDAAGEKKSFTRAELKEAQRKFKADLKNLRQMLDRGLAMEDKRKKSAVANNRIEKQIKGDKNGATRLLVLKKEIAAVLKGAVGKTPAVESKDTKRTRTGMQEVFKYKFLGTGLDTSLAAFKKGLPMVRPSVVSLLMIYLSECGIHPKVCKKGEQPEFFSLPANFVSAFKKVAPKADVDPAKMTFSDVQRMIHLITDASDKKLSQEEQDAVLGDFDMIRLARDTRRQEREAKTTSA